jgi:hypothetical protein
VDTSREKGEESSEADICLTVVVAPTTITNTERPRRSKYRASPERLPSERLVLSEGVRGIGAGASKSSVAQTVSAEAVAGIGAALTGPERGLEIVVDSAVASDVATRTAVDADIIDGGSHTEFGGKEAKSQDKLGGEQKKRPSKMRKQRSRSLNTENSSVLSSQPSALPLAVRPAFGKEGRKSIRKRSDAPKERREAKEEESKVDTPKSLHPISSNSISSFSGRMSMALYPFFFFELTRLGVQHCL